MLIVLSVTSVMPLAAPGPALLVVVRANKVKDVVLVGRWLEKAGYNQLKLNLDF
jgi:hypothetical protein